MNTLRKKLAWIQLERASDVAEFHDVEPPLASLLTRSSHAPAA